MKVFLIKFDLCKIKVIIRLKKIFCFQVYVRGNFFVRFTIYGGKAYFI